jgi:hypothetical protein
MGKGKSGGKEKNKSSQLVIRIDKAERAAFVTLCEELDTSAAREIRRFMREFVASHAKGSDPSAETGNKAAVQAAVTEPRPIGAPVILAEPEARPTKVEAKPPRKPRVRPAKAAQPASDA